MGIIGDCVNMYVFLGWWRMSKRSMMKINCLEVIEGSKCVVVIILYRYN